MRIIEARAAKFNYLSMVKPCDYCKSSPALLYCKVDSAFTCIACDAKSHPHYGGGDNLAPHERVWICEVCEQAPAAFTCKADAAALCVACDRDIHSANPLAGRHERVPVVPFYDTAESIVMMKPAAVMDCCDNDMSAITHPHDDSSIKFPVDNSHDLKSLEFLFSDTDQILDFESYQQQPFSDSVVPVQTNYFKPAAAPIIPAQRTHDDDYHLSEGRFEIDFTRSNVNSLSNSYATNTTASLSHSVSSSSSMDVGVVPDGISAILSDPLHKSTASDIGINHYMDREARVLRYREKRKNRKFEKTIRYASRKAYAETRPRIKGRFAKRTDSESDFSFLLRSLHC